MAKGMWIKKTDGTEVFNSGNKSLKDAIRNTETATVGPDELKTFEITHNLGYVPTFKVFITWSGLGHYFEVSGVPIGGETFFAYADTTKLYVKVSSIDTNTFTVKYFLFKNTGV